MKLLVAALCVLALLVMASCSPELERRRRQTAVDVDVNNEGGRPVGTIGVSRETRLGTLRGSGTFGAGKPIWSGSLTRQRGPTSFGVNVDHQGGRTRGGFEVNHRSNRWGEITGRGSFGSGGRPSFQIGWRKRFRRAATQQYAQLMDLLEEEEE